MPRLTPVPKHIQKALTENRGYDWSRCGNIEFVGAAELTHAAPPTLHNVLGFKCALCLTGGQFRVWGVRLRWAGGQALAGIIPVCSECWEGKANAQAAAETH